MYGRALALQISKLEGLLYKLFIAFTIEIGNFEATSLIQ
jgi:hypothetical protein